MVTDGRPGSLSAAEERYCASTKGSDQLNNLAKRYLPGGDSRSTLYHSPYPLFFTKGEGCWLYDADGRRYLDFTSNHTSLILGYGNQGVQEALRKQLALGTCFPGPTEPQIRLAKLICERTPSIEQVRFTNSGSEATMNALRAARAFTNRDLIVKAEGAFHGTEDIMEISIAPDPVMAGPEQRPKGLPHVAGIPNGVFEDVIIVPFNDPQGAREVIEENGEDVACVIVEPVLGSAGMIAATPEYLATLREVTLKLGALLIFDEVITYRPAPGGAQEYFGIDPDITCLGKMIGGGMPLGAFGGGSDVMSLFDPSQGRPPIHHGGSFNANPMSMVAGAATLEQLDIKEFDTLSRMGEKLRIGARRLLAEKEIPGQITGLGSLFGIHFTDQPVNNYRDAQTGNAELRHNLFLGMLSEGVIIDPRGAGCLSTAIGEPELKTFINTLERVLSQLA